MYDSHLIHLRFVSFIFQRFIETRLMLNSHEIYKMLLHLDQANDHTVVMEPLPIWSENTPAERDNALAKYSPAYMAFLNRKYNVRNAYELVEIRIIH